MSTTEIFAELIVIGTGMTAWIAFVLFLIFGPVAVGMDTNTVLALSLPAISFVYVVGIILDRLADEIFLWRCRPNENERTAVKSFLAAGGPRVTLYFYAKSRMRICRSWVVIGALFFLTITAALVFNCTRIGSQRGLWIALDIVSLSIAVGAYIAWRSMSARGKEELGIATAG